MPVKCKLKQAEYKRKYYEKNIDLVKQRARVWTVAIRHKHRKFAARYKKFVGCKHCGFNKYHGALDFHHEGDKEMAISNMIHRGVSIKKLKTEIRKCIVLCANCHREVHDYSSFDLCSTQ